LKAFVRLFDYVFILRPTLFYPIWTFFLAGHWGGSRMGNGHGTIAGSTFFPVILALSLIVGCVFILNQIKDIETDRVNGKLFLMSDGIISIKAAYIEAALLALAGLISGFLINLQVGLLLVVLLILSGCCYNYPPASWKNHPIMGIVTNAGAGLLIYSLGWFSAGGQGLVPLVSLAYVMAGAAVYLNTTLPDRKGDESTGKITFGVKYGVQKTAIWALVFEVLMLVLAAWFKDQLLFISGLIMLPFFIFGAVKATVDNVTRATKFSVLALAGAVCIFYPLYLLPVFGVFFLSKWYYKIRFNLNYPSFSVSRESGEK